MCDINDNPIKLSVKWNGKEFDIPELSPSDSVAMLKIAIENATGVRPERQKLLNVKFQGDFITLIIDTGKRQGLIGATITLRNDDLSKRDKIYNISREVVKYNC